MKATSQKELIIVLAMEDKAWRMKAPGKFASLEGLQTRSLKTSNACIAISAMVLKQQLSCTWDRSTLRGPSSKLRRREASGCMRNSKRPNQRSGARQAASTVSLSKQLQSQTQASSRPNCSCHPREWRLLLSNSWICKTYSRSSKLIWSCWQKGRSNSEHWEDSAHNDDQQQLRSASRQSEIQAIVHQGLLSFYDLGLALPWLWRW